MVHRRAAGPRIHYDTMSEPGPHGTTEPAFTEAVRLLVAPANFAGQGRAWSDAARRIPGVAAWSFAVEDPTGLTLPAHTSVPRSRFEDPEWARGHAAWAARFTHVLMEAGRPVLGTIHGLDAYGDRDVLVAEGTCVGMVAHGSDVRRPDRHVQREADSPFLRVDARITATRQKFADRIAPLIDGCRWSFVSTPDLVDDVPRATWLPVVVDRDRWRQPAWIPWPRGGKPRVVHAPSVAMWKGTELITPVLGAAGRRAAFDYRTIERVPQQDMPSVVGGAHIVLDQFALGSYGVAAVEAMAAGRVVVGHVRPEVRARVQAATGWELPIVQARAAEVADVLEELAADPDRCAELAELGPLFVDDVHGGDRSALVLRDFLLLGPAEIELAARTDIVR